MFYKTIFYFCEDIYPKALAMHADTRINYKIFKADWVIFKKKKNKYNILVFYDFNWDNSVLWKSFHQNISLNGQIRFSL